MNNFMDDDFLLDTETARMLYHTYASQLPIIDYHCHIDAKEIAEDKRYENITQLWLGADHYKWRAMRSCGISERLITGDASDYEKFEAFCSAMPYLIGNPLYHWSHLELKRYFGFEGVLSPETCYDVWELTKEKLQSPEMSARGIMKMSNVKLICTTNDPSESLEHHIAIREDKDFDISVLPAFRPDKCLYVERDGFAKYIKDFSTAAGVEIKDFKTLCEVLANRIQYFNVLGCRASDHSLEDSVVFDVSVSAGQAESIADIVFKKAMAGEGIDSDTARIYRSALMRFLAKQYTKYGWVMQLHFGAMRNVSPMMFSLLGADAGYDTIHAGSGRIASLASMLGALEAESALPRTILYSLNPAENTAVAALVGCFQRTGEELEGLSCMPKMQQGSAWWFNDNIDGMRAQLTTFANQSALGKFIGMTTDSRSFLSYTRHEYFRRIFCSVLGGYVERGEYPLDVDTLAQMVCDVCYNNTKDYFDFRVI
ncbi:MAG: glucuronate isomerase [Clostridia bacterium]|nr:glucuronate isomerase [Clostridia bacterium]